MTTTGRRKLGDRRGRPRFEVIGQLWGWLEVMESLTLHDLGLGGALVECPIPLTPDSVHRLRFNFDGQATEIQARVRHLRPNPAGPHGGYLVGLEFMALRPGAANQNRATDGGRRAARLRTEECQVASGEERRRRDRVKLTGVSVQVQLPVSATVQLLDVSQTGVLVAGTQRIEVGRRGHLRTRLGADPVALPVEVKRVTATSSGSASSFYKMGAEFVGLDDESRRKIEQLLKVDG